MANVNKTFKQMMGNQLKLMIAIAIAAVILVLMQMQYWYGDYGHANLAAVKTQLREQNRLNQEQIYKNNILLADVKDLKSGLSAIEEHARLDLGLIKPGETFIQLSNAPITYSRQPLPEIDEGIESVDSVPEPTPDR